MSRLLRTGLAVVATLAVAPAGAAEVTAEPLLPPRESPRALDGHVFQPSGLIPGPFSATSFGTDTTFGGGEAEAPRYDLQGNQTGTRKYPVAAYGQTIGLDLRVTPDVALRLRLNGLLFAGTNGRSLLVAGGTAQYGFLLGLVAGRDLGPATRLSFVADASVEPQLSVLVASAVLRAIQSRSFDEGGLFSSVSRVRGAPGLSFAWAPSAALGFTAEARYVWTRRISSDDSRLTGQGVSLGGTGELDLDPLVRWPIAFQAAYRSEIPVGGGGIARVNQAGAAVYYTRRTRLALGLEALWRRGEVRPGVQPSLETDSVTATLRFRYYW